jgi:hypothetical protein
VQLGEIIEIAVKIPPDDDEDGSEDGDGGCKGGGDADGSVEWPIEWVSAYVSALRVEEGEVFFDVMVTGWDHRSTPSLSGPYKASLEGHEWRRCNKGMASQSDLNAAFKQTSFIDWFRQGTFDPCMRKYGFGKSFKSPGLQLDWSPGGAACQDLIYLCTQHRYECYTDMYVNMFKR